ncbi:MAG: carbohydrate ABC transporter permease [Defluviitaleaceae bacterium]|nr:carbohydrate ABC transporter permease [Defluviitaleaceae bacterium]
MVAALKTSFRKKFPKPQYIYDEHGKKIGKLAKRTKRLNRSTGGTVVLFIFMGLLAVFMGFPLFLTVSNALKPLDELFLFPPQIVVRNPTLSNFSDLFVSMQATWVPFSRYAVNTLIITLGGTLGHLMFASSAAYALAKVELPGRKMMFSMVVLSLMFAAVVTSIPNFIIISSLGLIDTYWAIILPAFSAPLGLYLMKQFMEQIPDSLVESARIDGASEYRIYWSIVMPNVKPAWLTLIILQFQGLWATTGGIFIRSEELKPLSFAMGQIAGGGIARAGESAAVMFLMMIIPVTFFIIAQSQMIETLTTSGMKD